MANVYNSKVAYIRKMGYDNLKEVMENKDNVYIGRRGIVFIDKKRYPEKDSPFCNPYKIGKDGTREEVLEKYELYIKKKIENKEVDINELKGKNLFCWCKPEACHGDVLVKILQSKIASNIE